MGFLVELLGSGLMFIYGFVGDYGIAIVFLTIGVRMILIPLSIKQKKAMFKQQIVQLQIEDIKKKYKHNKKKLEEEMMKKSQESLKSMGGCLITLFQLPVIWALYRTILLLPVETYSVLIPWVKSLASPDIYLILPIIYASIAIISYYITQIKYFKTISVIENNIKAMPIINAIVYFIISFKMPVALAIYFISTSIFSILEDVSFKVLIKKQVITV